MALGDFADRLRLNEPLANATTASHSRTSKSGEKSLTDSPVACAVVRIPRMLAPDRSVKSAVRDEVFPRDRGDVRPCGLCRLPCCLTPGAARTRLLKTKIR